MYNVLTAKEAAAAGMGTAGRCHRVEGRCSQLRETGENRGGRGCGCGPLVRGLGWAAANDVWAAAVLGLEVGSWKCLRGSAFVSLSWSIPTS